MLERVVRMSLLVLSAGAVLYPLVLGVGMMFISLMFCDSGPISHCAEAGLMFFGVAVLLALCAYAGGRGLRSANLLLRDRCGDSSDPCRSITFHAEWQHGRACHRMGQGQVRRRLSLQRRLIQPGR